MSSFFLEQIHHVAIIVSDYQKAKEFYVEKLGFEILHEAVRDDRDDIKLDVRSGMIQLEIFYKKDAPMRPNYPEALGLRHLAFKVPDIAAAIRQLNDRKITTEPIRVDPYTGKKATFFLDPDGLPLELYEE